MMPRKIAYGENSAKDFEYPENSLIITTTTPDIYEKWLSYMGIKNYEIYDKVTPDQAIETIEEIKKKYEERYQQLSTIFVCKKKKQKNTIFCISVKNYKNYNFCIINKN